MPEHARRRPGRLHGGRSIPSSSSRPPRSMPHAAVVRAASSLASRTPARARRHRWPSCSSPSSPPASGQLPWRRWRLSSPLWLAL
ncbi:Os08g0562866, partial [Oryza sativa Japonica Group]